MSRRLALLLLVVLAVPAIALAADTDPHRKINAADERKAASIVFKRTDFAAGWKRTATLEQQRRATSAAPSTSPTPRT